jgi:hypothetical protein
MFVTIVRDQKKLDIVVTNSLDPSQEGYKQSEIMADIPADGLELLLKIDDETLEVTQADRQEHGGA